MELLDKAFVSDKNREKILNIDLQKTAGEYLKFRHFVRHTYGFMLKYEQMEDLVNGIEVFWKNTKENIINFMENKEKEEEK